MGEGRGFLASSQCCNGFAVCLFSHVDHSRAMPHIFSRSLSWQCPGNALNSLALCRLCRVEPSLQLGAGQKGCEVVVVMPAWSIREPCCCVQRQRRGEGRWECFCSLLPSSKSKALSPWKPGQLFLPAEGLSPDWNDSFELEDIISLAC